MKKAGIGVTLASSSANCDWVRISIPHTSHAEGVTPRRPLLLHHLFTICRLPVIDQPDEVHAGVPGGNIQPDGRLVLGNGG